MFLETRGHQPFSLLQPEKYVGWPGSAWAIPPRAPRALKLDGESLVRLGVGGPPKDEFLAGKPRTGKNLEIPV